MNAIRSFFLCMFSSLFLLGFVGCMANTVSVSEPPVQTVTKPEYHIKFEPQKQGAMDFSVFRLTIKNQSDEPLRIDWHKSPYLFNGERHGMFVSKDSEPGNVRDPKKRYETIAPGTSYSKDIAPMELVAYAYSKYSQEIETPPFSAGPIPAGKSGILLVLMRNDGEFTERIEVDIIDTDA
jgi:hypothetical protein